MLLIKSKQHVSKDNISRIKLTPVNSADEDQVELLEKVKVAKGIFQKFLIAFGTSMSHTACN